MCGFRVGSCTGFELNSIDRSDRNSCKLFEREQWCGVCVCVEGTVAVFKVKDHKKYSCMRYIYMMCLWLYNCRIYGCTKACVVG